MANSVQLFSIWPSPPVDTGPSNRVQPTSARTNIHGRWRGSFPVFAVVSLCLPHAAPCPLAESCFPPEHHCQPATPPSRRRTPKQHYHIPWKTFGAAWLLNHIRRLLRSELPKEKATARGEG